MDIDAGVSLLGWIATAATMRGVGTGSERAQVESLSLGTKDPMPDVPAESLESTVELIRRVREGDQGSLERLIQRHLAPLRRYATGRLPRWARDLADTDDLVQDTLLRTFSRMDTFEMRGAGALHAYLRQAVMNRLRDELRRRGRMPTLVEVDEVELAGEGSPLEETIGREAAERYVAALGRLEPEEREVIIGRVEMEYSYAELAEILGKPTADAARKAAQRALLRLAEEMKP
jgi:RNA polymerase sigma factor (sigma-70 family)